MWELFKNTLRLFFRRKSLLFWTLIFPLILSTLFYVAIKPAYEGSVLENPIKVAVVNQSEKERFDAFEQVISELKYKGDMKMFEATTSSYDDAIKMLEEDKVEAVYILEEEVQVVTRQMKTSTYIVETIGTTFNQKQELFKRAVEVNGYESAISILQSDFDVAINEIELKNNDTMSLQYYTIFGMSCFYSAYWGLQTSSDSEGNQSDVGARKMLAPTSKFKVLLTDYVLCFSISFASQVIVFSYMLFILGMQIGDYGAWMLLLLAVGSLAGISWGKIVASAFNCKESLKSGILTLLPLIGSMFSGMMSVQVRRLPFAELVNAYNPMNWISEGMYSLYVYGFNDQYLKNLFSLLLFTIVAFVFSLIVGRRKQYESL